MSSTPQPTWRPISWLPTISSAISGGLATAQEFHGTLEQGWERPYRMDEATLARVRRVYTEQAEDVELYAEQLRRWQAGPALHGPARETCSLAYRRGRLCSHRSRRVHPRVNRAAEPGRSP